jgi:hypothetical protein
MLLRFALDADGVAELGAQDAEGIRSAQRLFSPLLARVGILVFASPDDRARLIHAVRGLPQELRKIWITLLEDVVRMYATAPQPVALSELTTADDLNTWRRQIRLALVGPVSGTSGGLASGEDRLLHEDSGIELARLLTADSDRLRDAFALLERDVQRGEQRDDVWEERFRIAASTGLPMTILDSYATQHLHRAVHAGGRCGLVWFLGKLSAAGKTPVHIISCANSAQAARATAHDLTQLRSQLSGVTSLSLTLASRQTYQRFAHARHVRFRAFVMCLDRGLSMFDHSSCRYSMPCPRVSPDTAREREEDIERHALTGFRRLVLW